MNNIKRIIASSMAALSLSVLIPVGAHAEWRQNGNHRQYYKNGKMIKDTDTTIDGKVYFFDADGNMETGWVKQGESWYYCYENGEMAKDTTVNGYLLNFYGKWVPGITQEEVENYRNIICDNIDFSYFTEKYKTNKEVGSSDLKFYNIMHDGTCDNVPGFKIENGIWFNICCTGGQPVTAVYDRTTNKVYTFNMEDCFWDELTEWSNKQDIQHLS